MSRAHARRCRSWDGHFPANSRGTTEDAGQGARRTRCRTGHEVRVRTRRPRATLVSMPDALDAVLVMKFAFVPGGRGRDWSCRWNGSGDWRTEHAVFTAIHVDEVVNVAYVVVIGAAKYGDQTRVRGAQEIQRS